MEKGKVMIFVSACKALDYKNKNPDASLEEITSCLMKEIKIAKDLKVKAMSVALKALEYKEKYPELSDRKIIQRLVNEMSEFDKDEE